MLDIFANPSFSVISLSLALLQRRYIPGLIGRLGLFTPRPLATTMTAVETRGHRLALVPEIPRGSPPPPDVHDARALTAFTIPQFALRSTVMADSVQNVRAFGSDSQLEGVQEVIGQHEDQLGERLDLTLEYLRLGAVKGIIVTKADRETGAPMIAVSLFEKFHVDPQPVIEWPIIGAGAAGEASFWSAQLTGLIMSLGRLMADNMSGGMYQSIYGIAGSVAYDAFAMHPENRAPFLATENAPLRSNILDTRLSFRGITIEEYRGIVGNIRFVEPDEIHFFPVGVPGLFLEYYAPGDFMDAVNRMALPRYSMMQPLDWDKGVELMAQMNVLPLCTAPRALFTVRVTNAPGYTPPVGAHAPAASPTRRATATV